LLLFTVVEVVAYKCFANGTDSILRRVPISVEQNGSCLSDDDHVPVALRWNDVTKRE